MVVTSIIISSSGSGWAFAGRKVNVGPTQRRPDQTWFRFPKFSQRHPQERVPVSSVQAVQIAAAPGRLAESLGRTDTGTESSFAPLK